MKRITGILLSLAIVLGFFAIGAVPASAGSDMKASDELIRILKLEEGFCQYPVEDYSQWTVGYGTRCPDDMLEYYKEHGITTQEAELLLRNYLTNIENKINVYLIDKYGLTMNQGQFDALVAFSFNMGSSWIKDDSQNIHKQVVSGATGNDLINAFGRWCKAGGKVQSFLLRRRLSEANMYLNGVYSKTPPDNYCYVTYNGNGGSISYSAQCYDSSLTATPASVATYGDYTFEGWYTEQVGGEKVEVLTAEHKGMTLYAHWEELDQEPETIDPLTVTVTVNSLNLRKGPGTNYSRVGTAGMGDQFVITKILENGGYLWGSYDGGWLALEYTDYEDLIAEGGTEDPTDPSEPTDPETTDPDTTDPETTDPDTTEPETTEPETTEPKTTEPETTEPETTEPETTEPETTEPETTEPETTEPETTEPIDTVVATGTIKANPHLRVRSGPSTGYSVVTTLDNGTKVEILELRTVGSDEWGRIAEGWISLSYVTLDKTETPDTTTGQTGTVTCAVLNVRSGAGVSYSVVAKYRKGDTITITETKTVGSVTWGKTDKGWVSMNYVKLSESSGGTAGGTGSAVTAATGVVTSDDVLRVRSGPGTSYTIVGYYKPGDTITITETKTVGSATWGKTDKGWVSMQYVKLSESSGGDTSGGENNGSGDTAAVITGVVSSNDVLNIRSGPGTSYSIVGHLDPGETVTVTETKTVGLDTWGKMEKGWINMKYVTADGSSEEEEDYTVVKTVNVSCLCVREGAGTGYKIVGYLYMGAEVRITEIKVVGTQQWGKIDTGWICMSYTK